MPKLLSRHVTWNQATESLLEAEIKRGRFANVSEAVRAAVWNSYGTDASRAELERLIDEAVDDARPPVPLEKIPRKSK
jgi:Arc/MetJ-type ribon-helix-helix transcriptional regulator